MTAEIMPTQMTADQAIGFTVNQCVFLSGVTKVELGRHLGVSGSIVGRKLRGIVSWSMDDLMNVAAFFELDPAVLLPTRTATHGFKPAELSTDLQMQLRTKVRTLKNSGAFPPAGNEKAPQRAGGLSTSIAVSNDNARPEGLEPPTF